MAGLPDAITVGALDLVRWTPAQAEPLRAAVAASYDQLHPWMPWAASLPSVTGLAVVLAEGRESFEAGWEWNYILREPDGSVVGAAAVHRRGQPEFVEVGYWVRTDRTGRGYATSAAAALTTAAFDGLPDITQVRIRMDRTNAASAAVPARLGFHLDGAVPRAPLAPGETGTDLVWSVTRSTWVPPIPG